MNIILLIFTQALYSLSDLGKRIYGAEIGFNIGLLKSVPFMASIIVPFAALMIQVYVLTRYELSRTMITLGVLNVVFATVLGVLVLKERLTMLNYVGVICAIAAIILINVKS